MKSNALEGCLWFLVFLAITFLGFVILISKLF